MAVRSTVVAIGGTSFAEERDVDTNKLLRRYAMPFDTQPEKTRRRIELRERIEEWFMFKAFVDEAALPVHGEPAGAISTGRTQQEALYQAARSAYLDWMNTT